MNRHSKVVNFSLPPELHDEIERLAKSRHRNRSQVLRDMIGSYLQAGELSTRPQGANEADLASTLKAYWQLRSEVTPSVIITGLVIPTNDAGEVLIASRAKPDNHVPNLSWSFPGSHLKTLDFVSELTQNLLERTGLYINISSLIDTRLIPESGHDGAQVVALYFQGTVIGRPHLRPKTPYEELKWVQPLEVFRYFTSSTTDTVASYLTTLTAD